MSDHPTLSELDAAQPFSTRHIGPDGDARAAMLAALGFDSLDALMNAAVPGGIRAAAELALPAAASEEQAARELRAMAAENTPREPMIGLGYHGTLTPAVVRRNVFEDPSWYTAYTPYQPEISQGRLEALINFQTMVGDLTGLPTANASLLDEGTAAAEAMTLARRGNKAATGPFVVDANALPQTIAVVETRAQALGIDVVVADLSGGLPEGPVSGVLVQYPGADGAVLDPRPLIEAAHERNALAVVAADLLALTLLESPGELGADVVVGTTQRFGVPLFYGGTPNRCEDPTTTSAPIEPGDSSSVSASRSAATTAIPPRSCTASMTGRGSSTAPSAPGYCTSTPHGSPSGSPSARSATTTGMPIAFALVFTTAMVCGSAFASTTNGPVAFLLPRRTNVIASAAADPSSSSDAFAVGRPVRSPTMVWKFSSASRRPCEISGW